MGFQFRVATALDVPAISELIAASVWHLQPEYSLAEREAAIATVFTVDSRLVIDGTYFVAFSEDGRLAGCGGWSKRKTLFGGDHQIGTIEAGFLDSTVDAAKIRAIFVHPKFARQGAGGTLLKMSEQAAMQEGFRRFEIGSTLAGVVLYKTNGYRQDSSIEVPVGPNLTIRVVLMSKNTAGQ